MDTATNNHQYRRQFLLTKGTDFPFTWKQIRLQSYTLYYHPETEYTTSKGPEKEPLVIYDWVDSVQSNQQLLDKLAGTYLVEAFLSRLLKYAGQYVIIYKDNFFLLHDVCAQCEIYYDISFSTFEPQPKLMGEVVELKPHESKQAIDFYSSPAFLSKRLYVGDTTHVGNVKHLLPNHYIDINNKIVRRHFPFEPIAPKYRFLKV